MFSSFFSFYFYIIHSFLRPQRKLFSTIVTTNAINVIPLFLLNFCSKFISFPPFPFSVFHANYKRQKQAKQTYCFIGLFCLLLLFILFFVELPVCVCVCVYSCKGFSVYYLLHFYTSFFVLFYDSILYYFIHFDKTFSKIFNPFKYKIFT